MSAMVYLSTARIEDIKSICHEDQTLEPMSALLCGLRDRGPSGGHYVEVPEGMRAPLVTLIQREVKRICLSRKAKEGMTTWDLPQYHRLRRKEKALTTVAESIDELGSGAQDGHDLSRSNAKLTAAKVREIRSLFSEGKTRKELGEKFNVHHTTIREVVLNRTWRGV